MFTSPFPQAARSVPLLHIDASAAMVYVGHRAKALKPWSARAKGAAYCRTHFHAQTPCRFHPAHTAFLSDCVKSHLAGLSSDDHQYH
jgi:hypothetical protein